MNHDSKRNIKKRKISIYRLRYIFTGGISTEFTKESPFIKMLIGKRTNSRHIDPSCHIAAFTPNLEYCNSTTSWDLGKIPIGENSERSRFNNNKLSTHAEMDSLHKLSSIFRNRIRKKQRMDLIVIRINQKGDICESAPCHHCTMELYKTSVVTINNLYFSRSDGTVTCVKFSA
ncbi:MAG: hypothetical protein Gaeavirus38_1, partial [Gaeavirus sp.]